MTRPADQSVIIIGSTKRDDPVYEGWDMGNAIVGVR